MELLGQMLVVLGSLRNLQTAFHSGLTNLPSLQKCISIHFLSNLVNILFFEFLVIVILIGVR